MAERCLGKAREAAGLLSGEERELAERFIAEKAGDMNLSAPSQKEPNVTVLSRSFNYTNFPR